MPLRTALGREPAVLRSTRTTTFPASADVVRALALSDQWLPTVDRSSDEDRSSKGQGWCVNSAGKTSVAFDYYR